MENIIKKYQHKALDDWGSEMSPEAKQFAKDFKRRLNLNAKNKNMEIVNFRVGHYYISGFIKKNDKYVYFTYNFPRHGMEINLYDNGCWGGVLVRTAEHEKDYHGGHNNFCNILQIFDTAEYLFKH